MTKPQSLYHYTTIEALAMILRNKTIRFSPLTVLDDLQEDKVQGGWYIGRYTFISSWTEEVEESIPMWKMYSNLESGIRIKLPINPFKTHKIPEIIQSNYQVKKEDYSIVSKDVIINDEYSILNYEDGQYLKKVEYTRDMDKIIPDIEDGTSLNFEDVGRYKKLAWQFQKEWRYILRFIPLSLNEVERIGFEKVGRLASMKISDPTHTLSFNHFYLSLNEDAFNNMEITLSPKISDGNRVIVEALKHKYNPNMLIIDSELQDDIR